MEGLNPGVEQVGGRDLCFGRVELGMPKVDLEFLSKQVFEGGRLRCDLVRFCGFESLLNVTPVMTLSRSPKPRRFPHCCARPDRAARGSASDRLERVSDLLCMSTLAHASSTKEHDNNDDFLGEQGLMKELKVRLMERN